MNQSPENIETAPSIQSNNKILGLVISEIFPPIVGGSGKWLSELYSRQTAGQYAILCGKHPSSLEFDANFPQKINRANLSMACRSPRKISSLCEYARQFAYILWKTISHGPRSLHAARPISEGLIAAAISIVTRKPLICYVHGEDINIAKTSRELTYLTRFVLRRSKRIIANSSFTRSLLEDDWQIPSSKISLMNPGIDSTLFVPSDSERISNTSKEQLKLFTAGRLQKRKGHDIVMKAVAELAKSIPYISYTIAGKGEEAESLKELSVKLGISDRILFLGEVTDDELLNQYQEADIFVLANRDHGGDVEGFGIVLLEAQSCGVPVIAGRSGGTSDTLHDGVTGYLVNAENEFELIKTIHEKLNDPSTRTAMGQKGRTYVRENFSWNTLSKIAADIYQSVL